MPPLMLTQLVASNFKPLHLCFYVAGNITLVFLVSYQERLTITSETSVLSSPDQSSPGHVENPEKNILPLLANSID